MSALSVKNLLKSYGSVHAVREVSFEVAAGEVFGLLGPNGAGKTSVIECVLGLRRADSGEVRVGGVDAIKEPRRARELVGAQLQTSAFQDAITPRQALALFGAFYPRRENSEGLLKEMELGEKADAPFYTLSFGQRRRLEIAVALVHMPAVVFLDEPTAGMDPLGRRDLHFLIKRLKTSGRAIVISTHLIDEAHRLCDRVAILDHGEIKAMDTPEALIAASKVPPWLVVRTAGRLTHEQLRGLAGVTYSVFVDDAWRVESTQMNQTIQELMKLVAATNDSLLELKIHHPTLEDVLLEQIDARANLPKAGAVPGGGG